MSNLQSLEIVGRGSETQLQVGENYSRNDIGVKQLDLQMFGLKLDKYE